MEKSNLNVHFAAKNFLNQRDLKNMLNVFMKKLKITFASLVGKDLQPNVKWKDRGGAFAGGGARDLAS